MRRAKSGDSSPCQIVWCHIAARRDSECDAMGKRKDAKFGEECVVLSLQRFVNCYAVFLNDHSSYFYSACECFNQNAKERASHLLTSTFLNVFQASRLTRFVMLLICAFGPSS